MEVTIVVNVQAAQALTVPAQRDAAGRLLSALLKKGGALMLVGETISQVKGDVRATGLTDESIEAELEAWRSDRNY